MVGCGEGVLVKAGHQACRHGHFGTGSGRVIGGEVGCGPCHAAPRSPVEKQLCGRKDQR